MEAQAINMPAMKTLFYLSVKAMYNDPNFDYNLMDQYRLPPLVKKELESYHLYRVYKKNFWTTWCSQPRNAQQWEDFNYEMSFITTYEREHFIS